MRRSRRPQWIAAAAATLVLAIVLVVLLAPDPSEQAVAGRTTTTTESAVAPSSSTTTTTTTSPPPTSTSVPTVVETPGRLVVTTSVLDFGPGGVLRQLRLRNTGGQPVIWGVAATGGWLTAAPASGGIAGGGEVLVAVSLDRAKAPEGPVAAAISVTGPDGVVPVLVIGSVDRGPAITAEQTDAVLIYARVGSCVPETTTVSATVIDGVGVASVVLGWRTPDDQDHTAAMVPAGGGVWQGELGPFHASGDVTWWIAATDTGGHSTRTGDHVLPVVLCASSPDESRRVLDYAKKGDGRVTHGLIPRVVGPG